MPRWLQRECHAESTRQRGRFRPIPDLHWCPRAPRCGYSPSGLGRLLLGHRPSVLPSVSTCPQQSREVRLETARMLSRPHGSRRTRCRRVEWPTAGSSRRSPTPARPRLIRYTVYRFATRRYAPALPSRTTAMPSTYTADQRAVIGEIDRIVHIISSMRRTASGVQALIAIRLLRPTT